MQTKAKRSTPPPNITRLAPDKSFGLTAQQVAERQALGLKNQNTAVRSKSYSKIIFENVANFYSIVTLSLMALLTAIGAWDYALSSCILFISIAIGIYQEIKAKIIVEKLTLVASSFFDALRNGEYVSVAGAELLLDELFVLKSGGQVPVDGTIVEGRLELDESILTGESHSVKKDEGGEILAGSFVKTGRALVRADKVGDDCYINDAAKIMKTVSRPESGVFQSLEKIIKMLSIGLVPMAALLFIANFSAARVNETLIAVSSAVLGMIPIGMFLLTSTAFAVSVLKLARRKTLLKDLYGIEMLAASDTLLFDKTGTITDGNLEVVGVKVFADIIGESQTDAFSGLCISDVLTTLLTTGAGANATAAAVGERFKGKTLRTTDAVMFDSDKKYSAAEIDGQYTYVLGAPDFLTDDADVLEFCGESSQKCRRTILLARAKNGIENISPEFLTPVMAMALEDSLRGEISETFAWLEKNNVNIKIVSGDDPATVCEIAKKAGLSGTDKYVNCARMDDGALKEAIDGNLVFGRASPEQKAVIVKELRRRGRVVCMVGDGVNDIQALKQADCSVSFACASDVARNISRIVLMDSEFKSIPSIIEEGRRVIGNVHKVSSLFIMKNLFLMFMTFLFAVLAFIDKDIIYPFDAKKMMMMELFVLGAPVFVIALESNKKRASGNLFESVLKNGIPSALSLIISVSAALAITAANGGEQQYIGSVAAITLTMSSFVCLFFTASPLARLSKITVALMIVASVVTIYLDKTILNGRFINVDLPSAADFLSIALCVAASVASNILLRKAFSRVAVKKTVGAVARN